jgi:hypothetical protein
MTTRLPDSVLVRRFLESKEGLEQRGYSVELGAEQFSITKQEKNQEYLFWENYRTIEEFLAAAGVICHDGSTITYQK